MGRGEGSGDKVAYWQAVLGAQTSSGKRSLRGVLLGVPSGNGI
jgi:hypothetical protein